MFTPFKKKEAEVIDHWIGFADNFQFASADFYNSVEKELQARQVPGLEISRIDFAEGGLLSDKRVYLRMLRERLVFDVCAAPFGTRYFFSCRMAEIPAVVQLWQLLLLALGIGTVCELFWKMSGLFWGTLLILLVLGILVYVLRNAVALGLQDLDATLIKSPVVGPIYERWFRKETYYRVDTRLMYLDTVSNVVKALAEEVTGAKGVKLLHQYEQAPILGELYKPVQPRVETERKA